MSCSEWDYDPKMGCWAMFGVQVRCDFCLFRRTNALGPLEEYCCTDPKPQPLPAAGFCRGFIPTKPRFTVLGGEPT